MAEYNSGWDLTRVASGNMDTQTANGVNVNQYCFVQMVAGVEDDIILANSGAVCLGVLQNAPRDGEHATVRYAGSTKIRLASSLGLGVEVVASSGGYARLALDAGAISSGSIMGLLISGATSGAVGELLIQRR